jgi:hypothetical protein
MKKLFYLLAVLPLFVACTSDDEGSIVIVKNDKPSTQVFAQGALLDYTSTRADLNGDYGYGKGVWPKINATEGWETAKFSIRIDASFPGVIDQKVVKYWSKKDKVAPKNLGKVYTDYPWGTYNDRDLDYYKVDKKTGENIGMFRYVLDPWGKNVNNALMEVPDMKVYCEWLLTQSDVEYKDLLKQIVDNWDDYDLIWYVAKEVGSQYLWHVNGYFKKKNYTPEEIWTIIEDETDDMEIKDNDVEDNVEIDIHKQEHKDWNEIKTSIHIRTDAESIKINIPIEYDNIVEADDFAIRIYDIYISGIQIQNMITHDENGITINITNIDPTVIERLKAKYGDGLTIEIHSYCKAETGVWAAMKQTKVETGKPCNLKYQITSAAKEEDDWVIYPTPAPTE